MEKQQAPSIDFLEIILELDKKIDESSFTEVFVRLCAFQRIEGLKVTPQMIKQALMFLTDKKEDAKSAYGLLRLAYGNIISLKAFPRDTLLEF